VVNLCDEYRGPLAKYQTLGIRQLWLPTVDHFPPSADDLERAVDFIRRYSCSADSGAEKNKGRVYVHCRAGHGRSAAAVFAWLISKEPDPASVDLRELNRQFCQLRYVKSNLWRQPSVVEYRRRLVATNDRRNAKEEDIDGGDSDGVEGGCEGSGDSDSDTTDTTTSTR